MNLTMTIGGVVVDSSPTAAAPVLSDLTVTWGVQEEGAQPDPATLTFSVCIMNSITDAPWLVDGAPVQLKAVDGGAFSYVFTGRIRRQSATQDSFGRLMVRVTCADYSADFGSTFVACDMPPDTAASRLNQLTGMMVSNGFGFAFDPTLAPASETRGQQTSISVKLQTLLDRFLAPGHRTYFDATTAAAPTERGYLKTIPVRPAALTTPATLRTLPDRRWYIAARRAAPGYDNLLFTTADNVVQDVEWTLDADNITTNVAINWPTKEAIEHYTAMTDGPEFNAGNAAITKYGTRRVSIDTDLDFKAQTSNPSQWAATVARLKAAWLDTTPEWQPAAVTFRDTDALTGFFPVLDLVKRNSLWVEISGVSPNQPKPGASIINAAVIGGTLTHTATGWTVTVSLSKTIAPAKAPAANEWTCAAIAASTVAAVRDATFATVGDYLTPNDFHYVSKGN